MTGKFMGYETDGVLVAASSPATESAANASACINAGAGAVIFKTVSACRMPKESDLPRRCFFKDGQLWARSGFNREIMPLDERVIIPAGTPRAASVTALSLEPDDWLPVCETAAREADGIQLDLFYIENLLTIPDFEGKFIRLLTVLQTELAVPLMPKLNLGLPASYAAYLLKRAGIKYVSLLDSVKAPMPLCWNGRQCSVPEHMAGGGLSVFGGFMLPLTKQYTYTLAQAGFQVCAGGGVTNGRDAAELMLLGASSVQLCTEVLLNGYRRFNEIQEELDAIIGPDTDAWREGILNKPAKRACEKDSCCGLCDECCIGGGTTN
jgi:dihydroorotate dehydrogenase